MLTHKFTTHVTKRVSNDDGVTNELHYDELHISYQAAAPWTLRRCVSRHEWGDSQTKRDSAICSLGSLFETTTLD